MVGQSRYTSATTNASLCQHEKQSSFFDSSLEKSIKDIDEEEDE